MADSYNNIAWRKRVEQYLTDVDIHAPTQTFAELAVIFPKVLAVMIDEYFRPTSVSILDIVWSGYYELCVRALIQNKYEGIAWELMVEATKPDQLEILKLVNQYIGIFNCNPLGLAICRGYRDIVAYVLNQTSKDTWDLDGNIESAGESSQCEVAEFLIEQGANAFHGLLGACRKGNIDTVRWMFARSEPQFHDYENGSRRPRIIYPADAGLRVACYHGRVEIAELMIELGATDFNGGLYCACKGHSSMIALMISHGATVCRYCNVPIADHRRA